MNSAGERAYVAAVCDNATAALDRARERAQAELDALLEEWSSNAAHQAAAAEAATRQRQEAHIEWLRSLTGDDASTDVRQIPRDASEPGVPAPPGAGSAGPPTDPYAAELAEAERIRTMPMDLWAEERQRLVRSDQGMF